MVAGHQGMKFSFYITFAHVGQDAVSKGHHCANTNVVGNWASYVDSDVKTIK